MAATKIKCVFVHGWGMNRHIWEPLQARLADWIEPCYVDLPGHGRLVDQPMEDMDNLLDSLQQQVQEPAVWIGWSLGGLAVCQLALQQPNKVLAMVQVASSPCFTRRDDWPWGIDAMIFDQFEAALQNDFSGTMQRFLALQIKGADNARPLLKQLRDIMKQQPQPGPRSLRNGLKLLKETDLRGPLSQLKIPSLWLLGEQDTLVKAAQIHELEKLLPRLQSHVFPGAAHAPFLSHTQAFAQQLHHFLRPRVTHETI